MNRKIVLLILYCFLVRSAHAVTLDILPFTNSSDIPDRYTGAIPFIFEHILSNSGGITPFIHSEIPAQNPDYSLKGTLTYLGRKKTNTPLLFQPAFNNTFVAELDIIINSSSSSEECSFNVTGSAKSGGICTGWPEVSPAENYALINAVSIACLKVRAFLTGESIRVSGIDEKTLRLDAGRNWAIMPDTIFLIRSESDDNIAAVKISEVYDNSSIAVITGRNGRLSSIYPGCEAVPVLNKHTFKRRSNYD